MVESYGPALGVRYAERFEGELKGVDGDFIAVALEVCPAELGGPCIGKRPLHGGGLPFIEKGDDDVLTLDRVLLDGAVPGQKRLSLLKMPRLRVTLPTLVLPGVLIGEYTGLLPCRHSMTWVSEFNPVTSEKAPLRPSALVLDWQDVIDGSVLLALCCQGGRRPAHATIEGLEILN
jgi:hypothetical protein